jgi:hypothetical protein
VRSSRHWSLEPRRARVFDVAGIVSRIAQRLRQPVHGGADAVLELYDGVIRPELLADFFTAHYLAGMLEQHRENPKGLFGKTNGFGPFLAQLTGTKIELKAFETDKPFGGVGCHCTPLGA